MLIIISERWIAGVIYSPLALSRVSKMSTINRLTLTIKSH